MSLKEYGRIGVCFLVYILKLGVPRNSFISCISFLKSISFFEYFA